MGSQPPPQVILRFKNGGAGEERLPKCSKNREVFCHVTHGEMVFSEAFFSRSLCYSNLNLLFKHNEDILSCFTQQNTTEVEYLGVFGVFRQHCLGIFPPSF